MKAKKIISIIMALAISAVAMTACSSTGTSSTASESSASTDSSEESTTATGSTPIVVCSREDGSGTRGAFIELFGVEEKDADGNKIDNTTDDAEITNSTAVMMTTVSGNPDAIGYISLGSLNDTVKALKVDGVEATAENIKSGDYKIARPFNIVTGSTVSDLAQDFINYIMSSEGQTIIEDKGYIKVDDAAASFTSAKPTGKIVVAGSSSVTPVMEVLIEGYAAVNPDATVELQESDSTTGINSTIDGICDIGMASRELKDTEIEKGVTSTVIAQDGIAVIVNNDRNMDEITSEAVKSIYTGAITTWEEIG